MKYQRVLMLMLLAAALPTAQAFGTELDDELNNLQVQVRQDQAAKRVAPPRRVQAQQTKRQPMRRTLVASAAPAPTYSTQAVPLAPAPAQAPRARLAPAPTYDNNGGDVMINASGYDQPKQDGFIYKFTLVPMGTLSTIDGSDRGILIPQNSYNTPTGYSVNFGGTLTADLNVFNSSKYVVELGGALIQTGSTLGMSTIYGYSYNDQIRLTYFGIPVGVKWLAKGEHESTPFVKLGVIPMIELSHTYSSMGNGSYSLATSSNEYRFGGYTQYDVMVDLALGYSYKINDKFQALIDIEGFQGLVPVFQTYNALNLGGNVGIGISYSL